MRINVDAGARLDGDPRMFGRCRARHVTAGERWELRISQTVRYCVRELWKETTEARLTFQLKRCLLMRLNSACSWEEKSDGVTPEQTISFITDGSAITSYRLDLHGEWPECPHTRQAKFSVTITASRMLYGGWLFLEIGPGVEFHQEESYEPKVACTVLFAMLLGGSDKGQ